VILSFLVVAQVKVLCGFVLYRNPPTSIQELSLSTELGALLAYGILFTLVGFSERLYQPETIRNSAEQKIILGKVAAWSTLLAVSGVHFFGTSAISTRDLGAKALTSYLAMLGWRNCVPWLQAQHPPKGCSQRNVLIVGAGRAGREIAAWLKQNRLGGRAVLGFLDNNGAVGGEVLGKIEDLARIARTEFIDEVIVALPHQRDLASIAIGEARRNGLDIKMVPDLHGFEPKSVALENCGGVCLLTLHKQLAPEFSLFLKRALDAILSAIGLILISPVLAVVALVIKLDSPGPIFYRAPRVGKKGNRFLCQKFRTMAADADARKERLRASNEREGACFKIANDPRITRVGRFLRRYSLDELPQLWNVLWGDMSLVGPRPHPIDDFERYDLKDFRRLDVTPGITGLWQVLARRDPSFQRNVALDVEYIEHWDLWMDLRILYKTVSVVLQGSGV
jgi:exopolysaccharide biosynthesis polyprenyl glycosylphosphotransferase